jgi:hypothetical protein
MKINRLITYDVFYNESEQKQADKIGKKLIKRGYSLEARDSGESWDYCDQYIKGPKQLKTRHAK